MADGAGESEAPREVAPEPGFVRALRLIDKSVGFVEAGVVVLFLAALIFVGAFQAVARNFFRLNPDWVDPIIRSSVFLIGMVGATMAAQADRLIKIDVLARLLSTRAKVVVRVLGAVFAIGVLWWFVKAGIFYLGTMTGEADTSFIKEKWIVMALPICSGLMAFHLLLHSVIDVFYLATGREPPPEEAGLML